MKKIITLIFASLLGLSMTYAQTFSDDFESYTVGSYLGPQSSNWRTWSGAGGGTDDVYVVSTDNHTTGGSKSIYFSSTAATGGPSDCVLPFNATPLSTGQFNFSAWFKIPSGKDAYFNFQGNATMGNMYTLDCFMNANGSVSIQNSGTEVFTSTHPFGQWFKLSIDANFNTNVWKLSIDDTLKGSWQNTNDQVYAIDIFPTDASASFWVDDVSYNIVPYTLPGIDAAANLISVTNGLVGQTRNLSVKIRNLGTDTITSFALSVDQNGAAPIVQNITGANLASLATTTINITTPFTLLPGANTFRAIISNVNGIGPDVVNSDDTIKTTLTPVLPADGKKVAVEEATGTWCGWCVRGAVYMDMMKAKYPGYFAGIAVHNGDPMVFAAYDAGIGPLISGYPTALVDRLAGIDPSAMETDFLSRIQIAPKAVIRNGATYDSITRILKVSLTTTMQQSISGDFRIACVLTEDDVTGTASGYNQANYYSGGSNGVMGGYELLSNPVPAAQMHYNHVGRLISPDFPGLPNAFGASANAGQSFTYTFTYVLPSTWDATKINIIGLFIDNTGKIDNASEVSIPEAITNAYVTGTELGTAGVAESYDLGSQISLYPNPTTNNSIITLNLKKASNVSVAIYELNGSLIAKKDYGVLTGGMQLPIETENLSKGMYFVNITIDGKTTIKKLVKE
ncbi:MAG: T9SS type A sorting domain-containing protein [Bacteroidota bacterium]